MFQLKNLLTLERTLCKAPDLSKKRLFENAADLICADQGGLESGEVSAQAPLL